MRHSYIENARIVEAPASSGSKFYVECPANDAILASCDTMKEAEQVVGEFNDLAKRCKGCGDQMYTTVRAHHHTEGGIDVTG